MEELKVMMVGHSGSGKTVYLATLHHEMRQASSDRRWFLRLPFEQGQDMVDIYAQIKDLDRPFPPPTFRSRLKEWNFTCSIETLAKRFSPFRVTFLDYGGERLDRSLPGEDPKREFARNLEDADVLIWLFDGEDVLKVMLEGWQKHTAIQAKYLKVLDAILTSESRKPVHFAVTKWDIIDSSFSLKQVRARLLQFSQFKQFVDNCKNLDQDVRLIPISSVGRRFVTRLPDGTMEKNFGGDLDPIGIDIPLAMTLHLVLWERLRAMRHASEGKSGPADDADRDLKRLLEETERAARSMLPPANVAIALIRLVINAVLRRRRRTLEKLQRERDRLSEIVNNERGALELVLADLEMSRAVFDRLNPGNQL